MRRSERLRRKGRGRGLSERCYRRSFFFFCCCCCCLLRCGGVCFCLLRCRRRRRSSSSSSSLLLLLLRCQSFPLEPLLLQLLLLRRLGSGLCRLGFGLGPRLCLRRRLGRRLHRRRLGLFFFVGPLVLRVDRGPPLRHGVVEHPAGPQGVEPAELSRAVSRDGADNRRRRS